MAARKNRRRRGRGLAGALARLFCLAALVGAVYYGGTVFFQVEEIQVSGNSRYTQEQVIQATGLEKGDNLFRMNKNAISRQVRQQLPYVESLSIRRGYPDTVRIQVQEWSAVAWVEKPQRIPQDLEEGVQVTRDSWLISISGKLLESQATPGRTLEVSGLTVIGAKAGTMLAVPQEEQGKLTALLALLQNLDEMDQMDRVSQVDLSPAAHLTLCYDQRFTAKLDLNKEMDYQLRVLDKVVADRAETDRGTLDLTQEQYAVVFTPE